MEKMRESGFMLRTIAMLFLKYSKRGKQESK
jgi:hypothetical protein